VRPYNQRDGDFPTLLALLVAVGFPLLLLALVFDFFPRDRFEHLVGDFQLPWAAAASRPAPSPNPSPMPTVASISLAAPDWPMPNGWFFTQTNGRPQLSSATGFAVTNANGLPFWNEFQRLGGVDALGYPLSVRFTWRGFTVQVFQKIVFQGAERGSEVSVLNVMDDLSAAGKNEFLRGERSIPLPLGSELDAGRAAADVPTARLALLADDPAIEQAYRGVFDAVRRFGLPTSRVTDMGDYLVAIRCQRAVLQRWKKDVPWAKAGEVTIANVGQIAIEAGLFPPQGLQPTVGAPPQS
jgi:hypothetical protein